MPCSAAARAAPWCPARADWRRSTPPPTRSTAPRTAARPTPRPDICETCAAVDRPAEKTSWMTCSSVSSRASSSGDQRLLARFAPDRPGIDPAPVVADLDDELLAVAQRAQADLRLLGLAGGAPLLRRLDAVVRARCARHAAAARTSRRRSDLSASVSSPFMEIADRLAELLATSRTTRGSRRNTCASGTMRSCTAE